jgi:AraC-like DNA-binding protein
VEQIQAELGMSRSAVYRLFESSHGVARYIKSRRLTRIRSILLENRDPRTLATLAADFGFQSSAHFSREFHRQFGCSPSETRAGRSLQGVPPGSDGSLGALYRSIQA